MGAPRQARLHIRDRAILAEEVGRLLERYDGSQRKAAEKTGIPQPQLSRMLNRTLGEMGPKQYQQLSRQIAPDRRERFLEAFFPPNMVKCHTAYWRWIAAETKRLQNGPEDYWLLLFEGPVLAEFMGGKPHETYKIELNLIIDHWERECPASYHRFHREMDALHVAPERKHLAMLRMLAPLLDAQASAFIERDWRDLDREEFEAFVDAGLKREAVMLKRSGTLQQLQQLGPWIVGE